MNRQPFLTHCFALIICQHTSTGKFLCVKETRNRGWWVAGGLVEPGEDFFTAAKRETKEEAGVDIELKGILRVEHSAYGHQTSRMRVIFYAVSSTDTPKQISDNESECAAWLTIEEIQGLQSVKPGLRGPEIMEWPIYIANGGSISPITFFVDEDAPILYKGYDKSESEVQLYSKSNKNTYSTNNLAHEFKTALENEDTSTVLDIIKDGFDVNFRINQKNWTALHYAIKTKNGKLVKFLLLSGADPFALTHKFRNCFHFAMQSSFSILKMLLLSVSDTSEESMIAFINAQDELGDTPLHILARDIVKYNTNPNNVDLSVMNYLITFGADPGIKNQAGLSANDILSQI